jgi:ribosome-associated translation inhibitor RaiA
MQVLVNTGDGLAGKEALERWANEHLNDVLARFRGEITRVEMQLTDENKAKGGAADMRCMLEARITGHPPLAVVGHAENMNDAVRGAALKLERALDHKLGKLDRHEHRVRDTIRKDPEAAEIGPGQDLQ